MQTVRYGIFKVPSSNGSASQMIGGRNSQLSSTAVFYNNYAVTRSSKMSKGMHIEIVTALAFEMWNHSYPSGDEYNGVFHASE